MASAPNKLKYNKELITNQSYIFMIFYSSFFINGVEHAFPWDKGPQRHSGPNPWNQ